MTVKDNGRFVKKNSQTYLVSYSCHYGQSDFSKHEMCLVLERKTDIIGKITHRYCEYLSLDACTTKLIVRSEHKH